VLRAIRLEGVEASSFTGSKRRAVTEDSERLILLVG